NRSPLLTTSVKSRQTDQIINFFYRLYNEYQDEAQTLGGRRLLPFHILWHYACLSLLRRYMQGTYRLQGILRRSWTLQFLFSAATADCCRSPYKYKITHMVFSFTCILILHCHLPFVVIQLLQIFNAVVVIHFYI